MALGGLSVELNSSGERKPAGDAISGGSYLDRQVRRQGCRDRDGLVTWLRDVGLALSRCRGGCGAADPSQGSDLGRQQLTEHGGWTFPARLQRSGAWPMKVEYEVVMVESCAGERRRDRSRDQVCSVWRLSGNASDRR